MKSVPFRSVYLALLALGVIGGSLLVYLCFQTLASDMEPTEAVSQFVAYKKILSWGIPLLFLALLVLQNLAIFLQDSKLHLILWPGLMMAIFSGLNFLWLDGLLFQFKKTHELWEGGFSVIAFWGLTLIGMTLLITVGNLVIVGVIRRKSDGTVN